MNTKINNEKEKRIICKENIKYTQKKTIQIMYTLRKDERNGFFLYINGGKRWSGERTYQTKQTRNVYIY